MVNWYLIYNSIYIYIYTHIPIKSLSGLNVNFIWQCQVTALGNGRFTIVACGLWSSVSPSSPARLEIEPFPIHTITQTQTVTDKTSVASDFMKFYKPWKHDTRHWCLQNPHGNLCSCFWHPSNSTSEQMVSCGGCEMGDKLNGMLFGETVSSYVK